jgi:small subunit ribosomal protein S17
MEPEMAQQASVPAKVMKTKVGRVVGDKMAKTLVVAVESQVRRTRNFKVHDEADSAHAGDLVRIVESRPFSKQKRWRLDEVLERHEEIKVAA